MAFDDAMVLVVVDRAICWDCWSNVWEWGWAWSYLKLWGIFGMRIWDYRCLVAASWSGWWRIRA